MKRNYILGLCLLLGIGLAIFAYAAERMVVCEMAYSEG
jgi:hypothetical protein